MRKLSFIFTLLTCNFCYSQRTLTTEQINRLADAGKVYGYIKYFHPYLQYKSLNWDSLFASNVEGIIEAKSKDEYAEAMQRMLAPLNDDMTCVSNISADKNYRFKPTQYNITDSVLYIIINDITDDTYNVIHEAIGKISQVKGVVVDMRRPISSNNYFPVGSGPALDWWSFDLIKGDATLSSLRNVCYNGFPSERFGGGQRIFFKTGGLSTIHGNAQKELPMVFVVSGADQVPLFALDLQRRGKAAIIQEQGKQFITGKITQFYIQDSVLIKMRIAEGINPDGSLSMVRPDDTYLYSKPEDALVTATKLLTRGLKINSALPIPAPLPAYHPDKYADTNGYPSLGYRVSAAAKMFSSIDQFHPFENLMDRNWEESYRSALPKFIEAKNSLEYMRAVAELYANIQDSHGFICLSTDFFSLRLNPVIQGRGNYIPPVITDVIENRVVVNRIYNDTICKKIGLKMGDVILSVDGKDPLQLIEEVRKYQCASTKASQNFFVSKFLLFGEKGQIKKLKVQGADEKIRNINMPTLREYNGDFFGDEYSFEIYSRDIKPTFKLLSKDIGYADFTSPLKQKDVDSLFKLFKNTKGIIFDVRGYPHFDASYTKNLAKISHPLVAKFYARHPSALNIDNDIKGDLINAEDSQTSYQNPYSYGNRNSGEAVYQGKVVLLMNEANQSYGEHICLEFKAICNATLIGSPTSGTNGGFDEFSIPGNLTMWFTGGGVSFPDGTRTQRVGIKPDITVYPTIKGIQAGKDEVLDRAVKYVNMGR
jgi:Peptidase family S41